MQRYDNILYVILPYYILNVKVMLNITSAIALCNIIIYLCDIKVN